MTQEDIEKIKQEAFNEALAELKQENSNQLELLKKLDRINIKDIEQKPTGNIMSLSPEEIAALFPLDVIEAAIKIKKEKIKNTDIKTLKKESNRILEEHNEIFQEIYDEADRIVAEMGCKTIKEASEKLDRMEKIKKKSIN